jgi:polyadenylation factor subunit 2
MSWEGKNELGRDDPNIDNGWGRGRGPGGYGSMQVFDGKRMRKSVVRKTVDFNSTIILHLKNRTLFKDFRDRPTPQPTADYISMLEPVPALEHNPANSYCTKFIHGSINKIRYAVNTCAWTPDARRLITGNARGEFTLWNGLQFNFETILQAHDGAAQAMVWSHDDTWMVSSDDKGYIKYWQSSMNNAAAFKGHKESCRDITFSPADQKFATASDDQTIKIWDFERAGDASKGGTEERTLFGHGWDVKSVHWHPHKGLLVSGGKDQTVKFWDPRAGACLSTLNAHKNTVTRVRWNKSGNLMASASRDQLIKIWDLRMMRELQTFKGHKREVTTVAWHPFCENLIASGSFDGNIDYWVAGMTDIEPQAQVCGAHDKCIWDLAWHPLGHMIVSASEDNTARFWARNRPGDEMNDKYNALQLPEEKRKDALTNLAEAADRAPSRWGRVPTVLQGFIPPSEEEEAAALDTIPGIGSYLTAKPETLVPGKGFKRPVRDDLEMDDAEFARLATRGERGNRYRRSEGSSVGALPGFVRPATVGRLKEGEDAKVKMEPPPRLSSGAEMGYVHPDRLQMVPQVGLENTSDQGPRREWKDEHRVRFLS